jgi:hypothetical protein
VSSLFGAPATKPVGGGFGFGGAASTPAFGAPPASTPAFGAAGSLFGGAAAAPAFGAAPAAGGLFGGAAAPAPAFSFAPASAPLPGAAGALVPAGGAFGAPPAPLGVATSPYGVLPEPPRVTPLPEHRVGLTQRGAAPPPGVSGPPRPAALVTPRSLTPGAGSGALRPRRGAAGAAGSASRMPRSPADFLAAAAGGTPPSAAGTPSASGGAYGGAAGTPASLASSGNVFVPRDDPRRLFIRGPLPSTEAAAGVSVSPASAGATPLRAAPTAAAAQQQRARADGSASPEGADGPHGHGHRHGDGTPSDAEVSAMLPRLARPDYYTEPSLAQLAAAAREDASALGRVAGFVVGRRGVGAIRWLDPVDVRRIDLDVVVTLSRGSVEVRRFCCLFTHVFTCLLLLFGYLAIIYSFISSPAFAPSPPSSHPPPPPSPPPTLDRYTSMTRSSRPLAPASTARRRSRCSACTS